MKITIEIPDEDIQREVFALLVTRVAEQIFTNRWNPDERRYKELLKEAVHTAVRSNEDKLLERAIPIAGEYMGKRGLKKLMEEVTK